MLIYCININNTFIFKLLGGLFLFLSSFVNLYE